MSTHESFWKAQIDATETLCRLLDEQGVEHKEAMPYILFNAINRVTEIQLGDGRWFRAIEMQDHSLMLEINGCTPELAVEVALGLGERGMDYHVEPSGSHDEVALFKAENAKLREFAKEACEMARSFYNLGGTFKDLDDLLCEASELGIEVE